MIIVMQKQASEESVARVVRYIREHGLTEHVSRGEERTIIGAVGDERVFLPQELERLPQVERAMRVLNDWRIISREAQASDSVITVRGVPFGGARVLDVLPPADGKISSAADAVYLDPFFVSNSPYAEAAQANEREQVRLMRSAVADSHQVGKPVLVRVRDVRQIAHALAAEADILYLGGELMTNRALHHEVGCLNTPVVLCKDKHHSVDDWLIAAEHIALKGNHHIMLGEAGTLNITPGRSYRLDVEAIVQVRQVSHLPVVVNIIRLWNHYLPEAVLYRLAQAAGANVVIHEAAQAAAQ